MTRRTILLTAFYSLVAMLTACSTAAPPATGQPSSGMPVPGATVEEKEVIEEGDAAGIEAETSPSEAGLADEKVNATAGIESSDMARQSRVVAISVENFKFTPNAITLRKNENVIMRLTGVSGTHGFAVPDLGINTVVSSGKTVEVELPTDKAGVFSFLCTIPCGPGHKDMNGTIIITE